MLMLNRSLWINNSLIENVNTCTTTALVVNKMIAIIYCIHCDCMLSSLVRKIFLCYLPVR